MRLLIGAPVYKREWILPYWFKAIEDQSFPLERIGFIFETSPDDPATKRALFDWHAGHPQVWRFDVNDNTEIEHVSHNRAGNRRWTRQRYIDMSILRNSLLSRVRILQPDFYFSLDTDIILEDPNSISRLIEVLEAYEADAVSPLMFMTPKENNPAPSVMSWTDTSCRRAVRKTYPLGEVFEADVIMAAKLMTPGVYNWANYYPHRQGEDLGWSADCFAQDFKLYCASDVYAPHIMSIEMLNKYLESGDARGKRLSKTQ